VPTRRTHTQKPGLAISIVGALSPPILRCRGCPGYRCVADRNARANGVRAWFGAPDALPGDAYTIVVANILANPLILLAPALARRTAAGGRIALSGILESQAAEVRDAYAPWFKLAAWRAAEGWVLLAGERG